MKCRKKKFFRNDLPNRIYLAWHLRSALQPYYNRYKKEYAKNTNGR